MYFSVLIFLKERIPLRNTNNLSQKNQLKHYKESMDLAAQKEGKSTTVECFVVHFKFS